jgi:hypothetical protein
MSKLDLFHIFKNDGTMSNLSVYASVEHETDEFEHTTEIDLLNPITIKAIVNQIGFSALKWKYWGNLPTGSIQIICESRWYDLLIIADKIVYKGNDYYCWKDDSKRFAIMQREDYLVVILERKQNS